MCHWHSAACLDTYLPSVHLYTLIAKQWPGRTPTTPHPLKGTTVSMVGWALTVSCRAGHAHPSREEGGAPEGQPKRVHPLCGQVPQRYYWCALCDCKWKVVVPVQPWLLIGKNCQWSVGHWEGYRFQSTKFGIVYIWIINILFSKKNLHPQRCIFLECKASSISNCQP